MSKKKSARKPATFTLNSSDQARKFLAEVCEPLATRIIEEEGVLSTFDRLCDVNVYEPMETASSPHLAELDKALSRLMKDDGTRAIGLTIEAEANGHALHSFDAGYLLGLAVGRRISGR